MEPKTSSQTKSFIILFLVALVGTYICVLIVRHFNYSDNEAYRQNPKGMGYTVIYHDQSQNKPATLAAILPGDSDRQVDTSNWQTYTDTTYNFTFKYPATWKVLPAVTKQGFYVLAIDPGAKYYNIKVLVNPVGYFAMDNLPSKVIDINGQKAVDVEGVLYGIKYGNNYFTFDEGPSITIKPEFEALVKSVQFK